MDCRIWQFALFSLCIFSGISASSGSGQWCVASKGASNSDLQIALNYACGQGGADCSQIQPGAICYEPNTLLDHASYAFNDYYQKHPIPSSCVFGGTATLTSNDPSNGNCHYASSGSSQPSPPTPGGSQPSPTTPGGSQPSPPSPGGYPQSPPSSGSYPPSPPSPFGYRQSPPGFAFPPPASDSATSASLSLSLLFTCGLLVSLQVANYI